MNRSKLAAIRMIPWLTLFALSIAGCVKKKDWLALAATTIFFVCLGAGLLGIFLKSPRETSQSQPD